MRKNMNLKNKSKGFTLVELLIAVVIVSILGYVGDKVYSGYKESVKAFAIRDIVFAVDNEIKSLADTHGLAKSNQATGLVEPGNTYIDLIKYGKDYALVAMQTSYENAPHTNLASLPVTTAPVTGTGGVYHIENMPLSIVAGSANYNAYQIDSVDTAVLSNYIDKYHPDVSFDPAVARSIGNDIQYTAADASNQHTVTLFIRKV